MKVALVYDRVNKWGGAERVIKALGEIWPKAPLYTAVYDPKGASWAKDFKVIPSFLNKIPLAKRKHEAFPLLMPLAFESFNFDQYDLVISITSEAAKGIITRPKTFHLCYCLTPTRYLWSGYDDYFPNFLSRGLGMPAIKYLQTWDKVAAQRPDAFLAISKNVQARIKKYYQRESELIYPPVDLKRFRVSKDGGNSQGNKERYFLVVSRLVAYKKVSLVIEAFNQLGWPLKIIGKGNEQGKLKRMAGKNIEFLGQLTDKALLGYYQKSQAVIFPQEEDFGIVPLEAQACGRPVIAFKGGGALETIIDKRTGLFFYPQKTTALIKTLKVFGSESFDPKDCRQNALEFGKEKFKKEFKEFVEKECQQKT